MYWPGFRATASCTARRPGFSWPRRSSTAGAQPSTWPPSGLRGSPAAGPSTKASCSDFWKRRRREKNPCRVRNPHSICRDGRDGRPDDGKKEAAPFIKDPRFVQAVGLLEAWIDAKLAYEKIPGISLGFVVDQDFVWSKGFGFADLRRREPATPRTIYSICSISKLFTSIAVMQLRDEGRLRLDDPVSKYLPWFKLPQASADSPEVTLRGLLTHSSGVPRESDHPYWTGPDFAFPTREEVVKGLANQAMLYPSDRYFQYSNLGMTLAGQIVEQVSGKPYGEYVRENILAPLGLGRTTPEIPAGERGGLLAQGYGVLTRDGERAAMSFFQVRGIAPAAGFASNVEDLARFASWQFRLLAKGGSEVLRASTLREMQRVQWMDPD